MKKQNYKFQIFYLLSMFITMKFLGFFLNWSKNKEESYFNWHGLKWCAVMLCYVFGKPWSLSSRLVIPDWHTVLTINLYNKRSHIATINKLSVKHLYNSVVSQLVLCISWYLDEIKGWMHCLKKKLLYLSFFLQNLLTT